jgi:Arc/MetJ family transcription regulator
VLKETGLATKRAAVEEALKLLLRVRRQGRVRALRGLGWEGNLEESRTS